MDLRGFPGDPADLSHLRLRLFNPDTKTIPSFARGLCCASVGKRRMVDSS
jgi:hypothetical protein